MQPELELASQIRSLSRDAAPCGRSAWSVAFQNGHSHLSRVCLEDEVVVLTTGPLDLRGAPQDIAALNMVLPAASRIVTAPGGLRLRTERVLKAGTEIADVCRNAFRDFQVSLDITAGAQTRFGESAANTEEPDEPASRWNAVAEPDGGWRVPLFRKLGALHASPARVRADVLLPAEHAMEVRAAVAEVLLRCTSRIRYVKACATPAAEPQWAAWMQAAPAACGMEEALSSVALACAECAVEARALQEPRLARRYRELASIWDPHGGPILNERW